MNDEIQTNDIEVNNDGRNKGSLAIILVVSLALLTMAAFFYASGRVVGGKQQAGSEMVTESQAPLQNNEGASTNDAKDAATDPVGTGTEQDSGTEPQGDDPPQNNPREVTSIAAHETNEGSGGVVTIKPVVKNANTIAEKLSLPAIDVERGSDARRDRQNAVQAVQESPAPEVNVASSKNEASQSIDVSAAIRKIMDSRIRLMNALDD